MDHTAKQQNCGKAQENRALRHSRRAAVFGAAMALVGILIGDGAAQAQQSQPVMVPFDLSAEAAGQLVDLRFLNHRPAGKFDRLRAEGDRLVWPDGREARFWGVNLQANALFRTEDADIGP
ncbi:MAG: hypothetical protein OXD48_01710, partial [Litoreibacter sp.]|nr:hypothetical protein [Litoreibacter sp.]